MFICLQKGHVCIMPGYVYLRCILLSACVYHKNCYAMWNYTLKKAGTIQCLVSHITWFVPPWRTLCRYHNIQGPAEETCKVCGMVCYNAQRWLDIIHLCSEERFSTEYRFRDFLQDIWRLLNVCYFIMTYVNLFSICNVI